MKNSTRTSKPKAPKLRAVDAPQVPEQPEFKLTMQEMMLIRAYRNCTDRAQEFLVKNAQGILTIPAFVRHNKKPQHLRLAASDGRAH